MKQYIHLQFKAAFLLIIFSLNMIMGVACAIGVDMSINKIHNETEESKFSIHTHINSKKHHHEVDKHKHKANDKKDDCCNNKVVKLLQTDKSVPEFTKLISPVIEAVFMPVYYTNIISYSSQVSTSNKYYVRGHHPPIPDIRIAIQSFQI